MATLLCVVNLVPVLKSLSCSGNQGNEMVQLGTEILDFGRNDLEEEVCLGLLRETDPRH